MLYGYSIRVLQYVSDRISMNIYERKMLHFISQWFFPFAFHLMSFSVSEITGNCIVLETEIKVSFLVIMG